MADLEISTINDPPPFPDGISPPAPPRPAPSASVSQKSLLALPHNRDFPPSIPTGGWTSKDPVNEDTARYIRSPESQGFYRPWLAIPGKRAFIWPIGIEGFNVDLRPTVGIHKYLGDNAVDVEVTHIGEEHITLTGVFPGKTSAAVMNALRDIVYLPAKPPGKILYMPFVFPKYQWVQVDGATFDHAQDERMRDITYTISFIKTGVKAIENDPARQTGRPTITTDKAPRGRSGTYFAATDTVNTLRKVADTVDDDSTTWNRLYKLNQDMFIDDSIPIAEAPDFRLKTGTKVYY